MSNYEIAFGTDGWRERFDNGFNEENVNTVALGIIKYVKENLEQKTFIVGYDGRKNAFEFAKKFAKTVAKAGFVVFVSDEVCPTPAIAYCAKSQNSIGIMFTASHNSCDYLGIKFIPSYGGPATDEITEKIVKNIKIIQNEKEKYKKLFSQDEYSNFTLKSFKNEYIAQLEKQIDFNSIKQLNCQIIIDFLHSASIGFLDYILDKHEIKYKKMHNWHDQNFGSKLPDPKPKNLVELSNAIKNSEEKTIGLSNDGDADRYGVINESGDYVSPNEIMCILTKHLKDNKNASGALIKTVASSSMLNIFARKNNLDIFETKVGFKWLGLEMRKRKTILAGEESGGLSIGTHISEKDGILANLLILEVLGKSQKTLCQLQQELKQSIGCEFFNHRIDVKFKNEIIFDEEKFCTMFKYKEISHLEGAKIILEDGLSWILIRKSGTEPLLRIYFESTSEQRLKELVMLTEKFLNCNNKSFHI